MSIINRKTGDTPFIPSPKPEMQRRVKLGTREVLFPSDELQLLEDSTHLLHDAISLRQQLIGHGYIFLRGLHKRDDVLKARKLVLDHLSSVGDHIIDESTPEDGVLNHRCEKGCIPFLEGKNDLTHSKVILNVIEGKRPKMVFQGIFGEDALTFDYKWLRGMYLKGYTGAHVDNVYMSRGSDRVLTMWTPMGDTTVEMGVLAVCEGSHKLPSFKHFQDTYGSCDIEKEQLEGTGWFTDDPMEISRSFGGQWKTADFEAGDVLIFSLRTVHMSTANITKYIRISCDTRWQPLSENVDHRFMSHPGTRYQPKFGVHASDPTDGTPCTMDSLKRKWGFEVDQNS